MELNLDWRRETSTVWPQVSYELRPLKVWAFSELMEHWARHAADDESGEGTRLRLEGGAGLGLMAVARRIFPTHVRAVRGLTLCTDGEHQEATVEALCDEAPLLPLAGEIIARLVAISEVGETDEKN